MRKSFVISLYTSTLLLAAMLGLAACNDSGEKQNKPVPSPTTQNVEEAPLKSAQKRVSENAQPLWKEMSHTAADDEIFQSLGKTTQFFINTHSVEHNPGHANWRNVVASINVIPTANEEQSIKPLSLMVRYTVDCMSNLVLPLDVYLFDHKQAQGKLLLEQPLAIGPVKLNEQDVSFYNEMKNEVCRLDASNPLDLLMTAEPDWQLIHEPQPPQANPFFAYIDKKSVHPSIEHSHWKRATMLTQLNEIAQTVAADQQSAQPTSQLWQVSVDCQRQQFRFDYVADMEQLQGKGQIMQVGLSDKGFEIPQDKLEKALVERVCNTTL